MRDAWRFLMNTVDEPLTVDYICKINGFIARNEALEWGVLRRGSVGISGTDYKPPVPVYETISAELDKLLSADKTATEKALDAFAWGARGQFFWDGNKRTSLTVANKILLMNGAGILTITDQHMEAFNTALLTFYNSGEAEPLKQFLYDHAINGIDL